ncbi:Cysteine/Histidine-rich C1 domain family protein [Thalictrum thalictroides]|uniref:Cysteine/Histidine-rich C1 domain family protein n=1 Tax=Thalictrum thalictroides TaxID=46969 RepID=A0A7J6WNK8_THATH|nr:Cysteine/Histidine-rich C1 domain family protein [Thalictrum thalictroides]
MICTDIKHFSHEHNLKPECNKTPFTCDGCKEIGWGPRFRCQDCNYDLHKDCALAPSSTFHPFYKKCSFEFLKSVPDGPERCCDACGRDVHGFVYHCHNYGYDLHPSCANLPHVLEGEGVELHLRESLLSKCYKCKSKGPKTRVRGWSYRSTCKEYHFHVSCMKDMVVGKWEQEYFGGTELNSVGMEITQLVPSLQLTSQSGASSGKGKISKYWRIVKMVLKVIISSMIGDPIGGITCLIGSLLSG